MRTYQTFLKNHLNLPKLNKNHQDTLQTLLLQLVPLTGWSLLQSVRVHRMKGKLFIHYPCDKNNLRRGILNILQKTIK